MKSAAPLFSRTSLTPVAGATRSNNPFGVGFIPPRWPFAVAIVFIVAIIAGAVGAYVTAPVGNAVRLSVHAPQSDEGHAAAAAVEMELTRQLRALKLDVGGPPGEMRPAVLLDVDVSVEPEGDAGTRANLLAHVHVIDDEAGGTATASGTGFGGAREVIAGGNAASLLVGQIAALVAPQHARETVLRRVTDGRASLRVFARRWAELVYGRAERLSRVHQARMSTETTSTAWSSPDESVRLMDALSVDTAIVAVEHRTATLLPLTREDTTFIQGPETLELRSPSSRRVIATAQEFLGPARHRDAFVAFAMRDGQDSAKLCLASVHGSAATRCTAVPDVADLNVDFIDEDVTRVLFTARSCLSGCEPTTLSWDLADDRVDGTRVSWCGMGIWWHDDVKDAKSIDSDRVVGVVDAAGPMVHRGRLQMIGRDGTRVNLTGGLGNERHPVLVDKQVVFYEVEHPDPDALASWTEVRRLNLP